VRTVPAAVPVPTGVMVVQDQAGGVAEASSRLLGAESHGMPAAAPDRPATAPETPGVVVDATQDGPPAMPAAAADGTPDATGPDRTGPDRTGPDGTGVPPHPDGGPARRAGLAFLPMPGRAGRALLNVAPALLLYAVLRAAGLLVLWAYATADHRDFWELLNRYDAGHYAGIVIRGYDTAIPVQIDGTAGTTNLAFFPLYPYLVGLVDRWWGTGVPTAQLIVAWAAGLAAAWGLYAVGAQLRNRRTGVALAGLWAVVPHALVESMGYTETLFTALAAFCLVSVLRGRWLTAAALCILAGLTRPTGVALIAAVGLAALVAACRRPRTWQAWLAMPLAPLGFYGFVAWVGERLGRTGGYLTEGYLYVQSDAWKMSFDGGASSVDSLGQVLTRPQPLAAYVTTAVVLLGIALLVLAALDRVPWPLLVYAMVIMVIVIGGADYYHAKARLLLPAFPLLLPVAYALGASRARTATVVFLVLTALSAFYGVYLCLVWPFSP
jgi:hypothetical protein